MLLNSSCGLTLSARVPAVLADGVAVGAAGGHSGQVGGHAAHHHAPPSRQDARVQLPHCALLEFKADQGSFYNITVGVIYILLH